MNDAAAGPQPPGDSIEIERGGFEDVPRLGPLWIAVHQVHAAVMPHLAPYVSDAETWQVRRAFYEELFAKEGTVLLLARIDGELVGYALSHLHPAGESWAADTWRTGPRIAEVESMSVLPGYRNRGIGGALLDRLEAEIEAQGVDDLVIGALAGNAEAIRLYERRGFTPTWLYLSRFAGRPPT